LRMGALTDPTMTARKIDERRRRVMATPEYFERYGKPQTPGDLVGYHAVIYTRDNGGEAFTFSRGAEQIAIKLSGRVRISATEGLRAAVFASVGLTIVSEFAFSPELKTGEVVTALDDWTLPTVGLSAVYPTGRMASAKARAFVSFVEECLKT
jgi:DNA-binding transcriptional LysR family regulator